jgi:uncharacterized membrane protein YphA (DoxX/SURF4 family)
MNTTALRTAPVEALGAAERVSRIALALVWIYEGIVPKLLFATQMEVDLVERSGLFWPTPRAMLFGVGICEILGGLWLRSGRATRVAAALSILLLVVVGAMCAVLEPGILYHPFGGLSKNLGLIACAAVVYRLAPLRSDHRNPSDGLVATTTEVM